MKDFSYKIKSNEFKPSPFLTLKKDFSFILPIDEKASDLVKAIKSSNESIGEILIFDIYKNIEKKIQNSL